MAENVYVFPASFSQLRLWFLHQLEPDSPFYNIPAVVRLAGSLDVKALEESINEIVRRHEILRTTFALVESMPVQVISRPQPLRLELTDLLELTEAEREAAALKRATLEAMRPFDLSRGPLLRASLLKLGEQDHMLLLTLHHIISDGWSMGVLIRELVALYEAFSRCCPSPLQDLPIQYGDFAIWQREWLQGEVLERQLSYWKRQLGTDLPILQLPTDRPRPVVQTFRGGQLLFALPGSLTASLKSLSRAHEVTLFITLMSAFNVLLCRYTGQQDITVGTTIANRNVAETELLIGCLVNTLVIRTDLTGGPSFRELLRRVNVVAWEAYAHQDLPFEKLVEELQPTRDLSHNVLFQTMLSLDNAPTSALKLPGLTLSRIDIDRGTALFDLLLLVEETEQGLRGVMQYNTDLFDAVTVERMLAHFRTLLQSAITAADESILKLPMLAEAERFQLLVEWNDTRFPYSGDECIHQMFEAQAERTPYSSAVVCGAERLTYRELNGRANQLAHRLRSIGVGAESLVGICMERSIEMIVAIFGVIKAGGAYVPLDPQYPKGRLAQMLEDAEVRVLIAEQGLADELGKQAKTMISMDTEWASIASESEANPVTTITPDNLVYAIYTSGSTGRPKGTMIQHRSLVSYTKTVISGYGMRDSDRVLQFCSLSFDISAEEIYPCLTCGATLVLRNDQMIESVPLFLETCRNWGVTVLSLPTAYWHEITASLGTEVDSLPASFRLIIIAGERALPERLASWRRHVGTQVRLINTYGLTESTIISTLCELTSAPQLDASAAEISIGRVIRNTQIYILDQGMQPVPIGLPGEIYIGGLLLARGYFNRPDLTAEKFIPDPFGAERGGRLYRTGDAARYLRDGNIEFLGRIDQQVKLRGYRIELGEIEAALSQHPLARENIVIAQEYLPGKKRLVAYIALKQEHAPGPNEFRSFLQQRLPAYMVPSLFILMGSLPLTPNGKVDRKALPAPEGNRAALEAAYVAPQNEVEKKLSAIWQDVLHLEQVGAEDNFFDLGGHSLLMIELHAKITRAFDREMSMIKLFKYPTIKSLAQYLSEEGAEQTPAQLTPEEARRRKESKRRRRQVREMSLVDAEK